MPRHESTHPGALAAVTADAVAASATTTMSQHVEMHVTGRRKARGPTSGDCPGCQARIGRTLAPERAACLPIANCSSACQRTAAGQL